MLQLYAIITLKMEIYMQKDIKKENDILKDWGYWYNWLSSVYDIYYNIFYF